MQAILLGAQMLLDYQDNNAYGGCYNVINTCY